MPSRTFVQGSNNGISRTAQVNGLQIAGRHLQESEECRRRGDYGQSFSHLSLALCILPHLKEEYYSTYLEVFEVWIAKVEEDNGFQEAMTIFEVALTHYPESPDLHHLLAKTLYRNGSVQEAWNHACLSHVECSRDPNAQETRSRLTNALVERWHLPMLNDSARNAAFKSAIERAVRRGHRRVLDIGSGTGLLSIFAKKAGAREVHACEVDKFMYEMAHNVLQSNSDVSGIQYHNKHSNDIAIPSDIPQKVSLVVSETVDAGLFGEHILLSLDHAWKHLLLPPKSPITNDPAVEMSASVASRSTTSEDQRQDPRGDAGEGENVGDPPTAQTLDNQRGSCLTKAFGRVIPAKAELYVALVECDYVSRQTKLVASDFPYFNGKDICVDLQEPYMSEKMNRVPGGFRLLSRWTLATSVDFNSPDAIEAHLSGGSDRTLELQCTEGGSVDAIVTAFELHLDEHDHIGSLPGPCTTCWENAVYPVTSPTRAVADDLLKVDFWCRGVVKLSLMDRPSPKPDRIHLGTSGIAFLNSKSFTDAFLAAAQQMISNLRGRAEKDGPVETHPVICDTTPFPVAGLAIKSEFPDSQFYVEDEDVQKVLRKLGITAHLCEDLEDEVDVLFMWPLTREGNLRDGIVKKIIMYRLMMAKDGFTFPQELDLIISAISSPVVAAMTSVDDSNTCGVKIEDAFNIVKTSHHLDIPLSGLPHTPVLPNPEPILRLSLTSGQTQALGPPREEADVRGLLVLGGEVVSVRATVPVAQSSSIAALPYWFRLGGDPSPASHRSSSASSEREGTTLVLSTDGPDSPCNQSMFVLSKPVTAVGGESVDLDVVWREGAFSATVQRRRQAD